MVSSVLRLYGYTSQVEREHGTTIEFAVKALLLNKIWTTRMVCKHVSTGYSSTNVVQESLFLQKKRAPTRSAESGIFRCYSLLSRAQ